MAYQDIEARRANDLERYHRRTAERIAQGLCPKCGKQPPASGRRVCEPCAEKKRPADRARHHRRTAERIARGLCPKCGKQPPAPELSVCAPCAERSMSPAGPRTRGSGPPASRAATAPRRAPTNSSAAVARPPSAGSGDCAQIAGSSRPRPMPACANRVPNSGARPNAPATRRAPTPASRLRRPQRGRGSGTLTTAGGDRERHSFQSDPTVARAGCTDRLVTPRIDMDLPHRIR